MAEEVLTGQALEDRRAMRRALGTVQMTQEQYDAWQAEREQQIEEARNLILARQEVPAPENLPEVAVDTTLPDVPAVPPEQHEEVL